MKTEWQLKRERLERKAQNVRLFVCFLIIIAVLFLQAIAHRPIGDFDRGEMNGEAKYRAGKGVQP